MSERLDVYSPTGQAQVQIGLYDAGKSISYYGELLRAFLHLNMMVPVAAEDWFSRIKENSTSAGVGEFPAGHSACLRTSAPEKGE